VLAQQSGSERVEGINPHFRARAGHKFFHAFAHFACCFIGESHREDAPRRHAVGNQLGYAAGYGAGFARARARYNEGGPAGAFNRFALLGVKLV